MLYREQLDSGQCQMPGCDHTAHMGPLVLAGRCHPGKGIRATYQHGYIELCCAKCSKLVVQVAVARLPGVVPNAHHA